MSTDIYEKNGILATVFAGCQRSNGGDRRMIQISGTEGPEGDGFVQLYPETLLAIADRWREYTGTEDKRDDKGLSGLALIIDRVEALRVRIDSTDEDEEIQFNKEHWLALCREALAEGVALRRSWETITGNLALPASAGADDVALAVKICVRDNRDKDEQIAALAARPMPPAAPAPTARPMPPAAPAPTDDEEIWLLTRIMKLDPEARRRIVEYAASRSK